MAAAWKLKPEQFESLPQEKQDEHLQNALATASDGFKTLTWAGRRRREEIRKDLEDTLDYLDLLLSIRKKSPAA